jgi:DNA-binding MarR family transcriptional regulator
VSQAHQLGQRVFSRVLKRYGIVELNPAQGRIIYALWGEDGLSQSEIARRTKLDKSTIALMLNRMAAQGQVELSRDPGDMRATIVRLTELNRSMHGAYAAASREMAGLFYAGFSEADIEALEGGLRRVIANLERVEGGG